MQAICYTVLAPEAAEPMFVRRGYRIEAGDRGWATPAFPSLPAGHVMLEASTADWTILWIASFPLEQLAQPPELVEPFHGYPQPNCRPVRAEIFPSTHDA